MHTMIVTMTLDPAQRGEVERHLRDDVTTWARMQPGFVSGRWMCSEDGTRGLGTVVFATAGAAEAASAGPRSAPPGPAWSIDAVEIFVEVGDACAPGAGSGPRQVR